MYGSHLTNAGIAAELWPDLFEGMTGSLNTSVPQGDHEDSIPGYPGYPSTPDTGLLNFNTGIDTAFTPTPTTSMGSFTTQSNYSSPVSNQRFNRRHRFSLPCHRTMLMFGPCWLKVGPIFASAITLRVDRIRCLKYRYRRS